MHWTYSSASFLLCFFFFVSFCYEKDIYYSVILVVRVWHCKWYHHLVWLSQKFLFFFFFSFIFKLVLLDFWRRICRMHLLPTPPPPSSIVCSWECTETWRCTYIYIVWKRNRWAFDFLFFFSPLAQLEEWNLLDFRKAELVLLVLSLFKPRQNVRYKWATLSLHRIALPTKLHFNNYVRWCRRCQVLRVTGSNARKRIAPL